MSLRLALLVPLVLLAACSREAASPPAAPPAAPAEPAVAAAPEAPGRFVVQVGAFADDATVRQTRQKVEKLGL